MAGAWPANRDATTFRLKDVERGTLRIRPRGRALRRLKVTRNTRFETQVPFLRLTGGEHGGGDDDGDDDR